MKANISGGRKVSLKGPLPLAAMGLDVMGNEDRRDPAGGVPTIDLMTLSRAVRRGVGHEGMRREDAEAIAGHILNFFGFNERIIDNVLEPDDRDTFYMLEDCGILETERDETTLYDGREWRIHYWMFRKERILRLAAEEEEMNREDEALAINTGVSGAYVSTLPPSNPENSVYHELADDVWSQRPGSPSSPPAAARSGRNGMLVTPP